MIIFKILGCVIPLIVVASAVWVYWDASSNKIGPVPDKKSFNQSAFMWGLGCIFLWIVVFPVYLVKRKQLIEAAKEHPVEEKQRGLKVGMLIFMALGILAPFFV